jgi:hypothetical protein
VNRKEKLEAINDIMRSWPLETGMMFGSTQDVCRWQFYSRAAAEGWARQMTPFLVTRGLLFRSNETPFRYEGKDGEKLILPLDAIG